MVSVRAGGPFARAVCESPYQAAGDDVAVRDLALTNAGAKIVRLVRSSPEAVGFDEIMGSLGLSRAYCHRLLFALFQAGKLERRIVSSSRHTGCGWCYVYRVANDGC